MGHFRIEATSDGSPIGFNNLSEIAEKIEINGVKGAVNIANELERLQFKAERAEHEGKAKAELEKLRGSVQSGYAHLNNRVAIERRLRESADTARGKAEAAADDLQSQVDNCRLALCELVDYIAFISPLNCQVAKAMRQAAAKYRAAKSPAAEAAEKWRPHGIELEPTMTPTVEVKTGPNSWAPWQGRIAGTPSKAAEPSVKMVKPSSTSVPTAVLTGQHRDEPSSKPRDAFSDFIQQYYGVGRKLFVDLGAIDMGNASPGLERNRCI